MGQAGGEISSGYISVSEFTDLNYLLVCGMVHTEFVTAMCGLPKVKHNSIASGLFLLFIT